MKRREFLGKGLVAGMAAGAIPSAIARGDFWGAADPRPLITRKLAQGEKYRVGILGCGNRSKTHISALNDVPDIEIAAMCDLVPHKMKRRAELIEDGPEPAMYTDMEEMFQRDDLDAVANILPNYLHTESTIAALEAGKHVLLEKPMALTVAECNKIIGAAERMQRGLQIGTQLRHSGNYKKVVETIRQSPVGKILQSDVSSYRGDWRVPGADEYPPGVDYWRLDQSKSGGVTYEMGAHIIDVNNWIFDSEPVAVSCLQSVNNLTLRSRDSTDHAGVLVRYANGALMNYGGNLYNYGPNSPDYFFANRGTVVVDGGEVSVHYGEPRGVPTRGEVPDSETLSLPGGNGNVGQWRHFARALAGEVRPYPDGYIGRQTVQICQGSVLSSREGTSVQVSELDSIPSM